MDKTTQDLAWSVLPKEFKEEVKKIYSHNPGAKPMPENTSRGKAILRDIFGHDNLTSDAEGEEMLCVSRAKLLDAFNSAKIIANSKMSSKMLAGAANMCINTFKDLFGSKCLPDNVDSLEQKPKQENNIDLAKLNKKLDAALNSETKESLEEWMEQDDDSNTRLQIAAQLLAGLLASGKEKHPVRRAFELTYALMEENKKR